jgi:hypothetical protein
MIREAFDKAWVGLYAVKAAKKIPYVMGFTLSCYSDIQGFTLSCYSEPEVYDPTSRVACEAMAKHTTRTASKSSMARKPRQRAAYSGNSNSATTTAPEAFSHHPKMVPKKGIAKKRIGKKKGKQLHSC